MLFWTMSFLVLFDCWDEKEVLKSLSIWDAKEHELDH